MTRKRNVFKNRLNYVASELQNYHRTKREYEKLKQDIILESPKLVEVKTSETNIINREVEAKVLRIDKDARLRYLENLILAIDDTVHNLPKEKKDLVELKYWQKPRCLTVDGIARVLYCSKATVIRWNKEILEEIATKLGLVIR